MSFTINFNGSAIIIWDKIYIKVFDVKKVDGVFDTMEMLSFVIFYMGTNTKFNQCLNNFIRISTYISFTIYFSRSVIGIWDRMYIEVSYTKKIEWVFGTMKMLSFVIWYMKTNTKFNECIDNLTRIWT